jgi:hypothetical protein
MYHMWDFERFLSFPRKGGKSKRGREEMSRIGVRIDISASDKKMPFDATNDMDAYASQEYGQWKSYYGSQE